MILTKLWNKFSDLGITGEMLPSDKRTIRLINKYSLLLVILTLFGIVLSLFTGQSMIVLSKTLFFVSFFSVVIWLNYRRKHNIAKHFFTSFTLLINIFAAIAIPTELNGALYLTISILFTVLLFNDRKVVWTYYLITTVLYLSTIYWNANYPPLVKIDFSEFPQWFPDLIFFLMAHPVRCRRSLFYPY